MRTDSMSSSDGTEQKESAGVSSLRDLTRDYADYLSVDTTKERHAFENNIEEMLTKLDEFGGQVDLIRMDTNSCINEQLPIIEAKCAEFEAIFTRIDKLEVFVSLVKKDVMTMEEEVNKAESQMGSFSSLKKMFSSFVGSRKSGAAGDPKGQPYVEPEIFSTEKYLTVKARPETDQSEGTDQGLEDSKQDT